MIRKWFNCDWKHAAVIAISIFACMLMFRIGSMFGSWYNNTEFNDPEVPEEIMNMSYGNGSMLEVIEDRSDEGYMMVRIHSKRNSRSSMYVATVRKSGNRIVYTSFTPLVDFDGSGLYSLE